MHFSAHTTGFAILAAVLATQVAALPMTLDHPAAALAACAPSHEPAPLEIFRTGNSKPVITRDVEGEADEKTTLEARGRKKLGIFRHEGGDPVITRDVEEEADETTTLEAR